MLLNHYVTISPRHEVKRFLLFWERIFQVFFNRVKFEILNSITFDFILDKFNKFRNFSKIKVLIAKKKSVDFIMYMLRSVKRIRLLF